MPLSAHPKLPVGAAARWQATHAFVTRCRAWAVEEIARRKANGKPTHEWESYLRFTDHTLRELEKGTLDAWFEEDARG